MRDACYRMTPGSAVYANEPWLVVEAWPDQIAIESAATETSARQAVEWLTEHERRCGRATIYMVVPNAAQYGGLQR